jgi:hypothetical protein
MILSTLEPWRTVRAYENSPEMVAGPGQEGFDPDLPQGLVRLGSADAFAVQDDAYADDWMVQCPGGDHQALVALHVIYAVCRNTGRHFHLTKGFGPGKESLLIGFEQVTEGGVGRRPHLRIPLGKQAAAKIRIHNLGFRCGVNLAMLQAEFLPAGIEVGKAVRMTREGSALHGALTHMTARPAVRRDVSGVSGYLNHLAELIPLLVACMRSLTECIYHETWYDHDAEPRDEQHLPSLDVDWDGDCELVVRVWLDLLRVLWLLDGGYFTKILTKRGATASMGIQDASEEEGGGFNAELDKLGKTARLRMRVIHGPHEALVRMMGSGAKELSFVTRNVQETVRILDWSLRGKTFCFCPRPDVLLPIAMTALKI